MFDPVTLAALTVGAINAVASNPVVQNVVGNRVDTALTAVTAMVKGRIGGEDGSLPNNHDVERAIRIAHVKALRAVTATFCAESPSDEGRKAFARRMREWLDRQVTIAKVEADWPTTPVLIASLNDVLLTTKTPASVLQTIAETAAWSELELWTRADAFTTVPDAFRAHFFVSANGQGWYSAFGAFIAEAIKEDERFRSVFLAAKLSDLAAAVDRYADEQVSRAKNLESLIEQTHDRLDEIAITSDAILSGVLEIQVMLSSLPSAIRSPETNVGTNSSQKAARSEIAEPHVGNKSLNGYWHLVAQRSHEAPLGNALMFMKEDLIIFLRKGGGTLRWSGSGEPVPFYSPSFEGADQAGLLTMRDRICIFAESDGALTLLPIDAPDSDPQKLRAHKSEVIQIAFDPADRRCLSLDRSGQAYVWDWREKKVVCGLQAIAQPTILARFAYQAERIATIAQNGELELFNASSGKSLKRLRADVAGTGVNVRFSIDDEHLVVNDQSDRWAVFKVEGGEPVELAAWRSIVVEAAVSTTNSILTFFSADGSIGVGKMIQGQPGLVEKDVLSIGGARPDAAALSESGERVAVLRNRTIDLWQRSGATPLKSGRGPTIAQLSDAQF